MNTKRAKEHQLRNLTGRGAPLIIFERFCARARCFWSAMHSSAGRLQISALKLRLWEIYNFRKGVKDTVYNFF
jgi:hypothetical protein